jgi:hypothetical protein
MNAPRHLCLSLFLLGAAACGGDRTAETPTPTGPIASTPAIDGKLAVADRADGSEDQVVHKCAACSLHMDGKAEHALKVGNYELHFCKPACLTRYRKDPLGELTRLKVE